MHPHPLTLTLLLTGVAMLTASQLSLHAQSQPASQSAPAKPSPETLAKMFDIPSLPANPTQIPWTKLPSLKSENVTIFTGIEKEAAFAHHPAITFFDKQFFAMWNDGFSGEDLPAQRVRFATSSDAKSWSTPTDLTGRNDKRRFTACGFWIRDNQLFALASLRDAMGGPDTHEKPLLLAYPYNPATKSFDKPQTLATDYFPGNIPEPTPDGQFLMLGKGGVGAWGPMKSAIGGTKSPSDWTIRDLPGAGKLEEAEWYTLPNNHLVAHFRTRNTNPLFLARSYSTDNGLTWSDPVTTNFPESGARHHALRLKSGLYVLLVNPNPDGRIPLSLATSTDGLVYTRIANLRNENTSPRLEGRWKTIGYHYMRGFEHDQNLYAIYSINKEDIALSIIPLAEIESLNKNPQPQPPSTQPAK